MEIGLDLTLLLMLLCTYGMPIDTTLSLSLSHTHTHTVYLVEAILGWTAVVRMSREQSARYQLTTQPTQGVRPYVCLSVVMQTSAMSCCCCRGRGCARRGCE